MNETSILITGICIGVVLTIGLTGFIAALVHLRMEMNHRHALRRETMQRHPSTWQDTHVRTLPAIDLPLDLP